MGKRRSRAEWSELLAEYSKRDCSQEAFCKQHGLSSATLHYQLEQLKARPSFVPVVSKVEESAQVTLEFASGIRLTIRS